MTTLYDSLLPLIQDIYAEGGNIFWSHISKPVLDAIDAGVLAQPALVSIRDKILEAVAAYGGKRASRLQPDLRGLQRGRGLSGCHPPPGPGA